MRTPTSGLRASGGLKKREAERPPNPKVAKGTTAADAALGGGRALGIDLFVRTVRPFPVGDPLPNIAVHIVEAPSVGGLLADGVGVFLADGPRVAADPSIVG